VGIYIDPVPGLDRDVLFLFAAVERPLIRGLGFAQLPANRRDEGLKVAYLLNIWILGLVAPLTGQYSCGGLN